MELLDGGRVQRRIRAEMMIEAVQDALPRIGRQHAWRIGDVAGGTFLAVLRQQRQRLNLPLLFCKCGAPDCNCRKCGKRIGNGASESDFHVCLSKSSTSTPRYRLSVISQLRTSAFSPAVHSRPTTSEQLRRNHFSAFAASVKRSGLNAGARGAIDLPVAACCPLPVGTAPWHVAQAQSRPCRAVKNCWPREGTATVPDCAV